MRADIHGISFRILRDYLPGSFDFILHRAERLRASFRLYMIPYVAFFPELSRLTINDTEVSGL